MIIHTNVKLISGTLFLFHTSMWINRLSQFSFGPLQFFKLKIFFLQYRLIHYLYGPHSYCSLRVPFALDKLYLNFFYNPPNYVTYSNVVNYVKFFYLDRQRQVRAQATFFYIKHEIVKNSLRAACKILLFYFLFWPFYFFFVSLLTLAWKALPRRSLSSHVRGFLRQAT